MYHDVPRPVDCAAVIFEADVEALTNASECGAADGSITLTVSGGTPPYMYSIGDEPAQASATFGGLVSGLYAITISDQNGCKTLHDSILVSVDNFSASFVTTPDTDCLAGNGAVEITVNGNTGPYQFALDDGDLTSSNIFEGLARGEHFLTIADGTGCGVRKSVVIPRGATGVSWAQDILPIMQASCAITGCHNGISRNNDWRIYAQVKAHAGDIRERTQNKSMPFDTSLPQDDIDLIACWIDDGALEN